MSREMVKLEKKENESAENHSKYKNTKESIPSQLEL